MNYVIDNRYLSEYQKFQARVYYQHDPHAIKVKIYNNDLVLVSNIKISIQEKPSEQLHGNFYVKESIRIAKKLAKQVLNELNFQTLKD